MIRVLVADDQAAISAGFAALIGSEADLAVAGEAADGREAVDLARRVFPNVISPLTAKTHVGRVLAKLNCRDRAQLVALAYEIGFVTPGRNLRHRPGQAA